MKESDIRKYAGLMKELELTGLEIKENNVTMRLERTGSVVSQITPIQTSSVTANEVSTDYISVKSPMVGVFYAAPAENAEPYVKKGDSIKKGTTLCIIETMKLMNEIPSELDGTVMEICVKNGQVVDYGCELFRIKR